jgi:hypothetical protein
LNNKKRGERMANKRNESCVIISLDDIRNMPAEYQLRVVRKSSEIRNKPNLCQFTTLELIKELERREVKP